MRTIRTLLATVAGGLALAGCAAETSETQNTAISDEIAHVVEAVETAEDAVVEDDATQTPSFDDLFAAESEAIKAETLAIKAEIAADKAEIAADKAEIAEIDKRIAADEAEIAANKKKTEEILQGAADKLEAEVSAVKEEKSVVEDDDFDDLFAAESKEIKAETAAIKAENEAIKAETAAIKAENEAIKAETAAIKAKTAETKKRTAAIKAETAEILKDAAELLKGKTK